MHRVTSGISQRNVALANENRAENFAVDRHQTAEKTRFLAVPEPWQFQRARFESNFLLQFLERGLAQADAIDIELGEKLRESFADGRVVHGLKCVHVESRGLPLQGPAG